MESDMISEFTLAEIEKITPIQPGTKCIIDPGTKVKYTGPGYYILNNGCFIATFTNVPVDVAWIYIYPN
jgi:hypothetical protein